MNDIDKEKLDENENVLELTDEVSMDDEVESYVDSLYLKNHILGYDFNELKNVYNTYDLYEYFVYSMVYILDNDPDFILLDESIPSKIFDVLQLYRFDCKDDTILFGLVNEIISTINSINSLPEKTKEERLANYLKDQSEKRKVLLSSKDDLAYTMVYDAGVVLSLIDDGEDIPNEDMFIPSLNLIMNEMPYMFKNKKVLERASNKLDNISKKHVLFGRRKKEYANEAKVYLKKIGE